MTGESSDMFDQLIAINDQAFEVGRFNVAYHALAAACHCAQDDESEEHLALVRQRATEQLGIIDSKHPTYEHSTISAKTRGHESIFHLLARQASTKEMLVHQAHTRTQRTLP